MAIMTILGPNGTFYGQMVHFVVIWYILWSFGIFFPRFGMLNREKSGNPANHTLYPITLNSLTHITKHKLDLSISN
jgi:hypothetical protein